MIIIHNMVKPIIMYWGVGKDESGMARVYPNVDCAPLTKLELKIIKHSNRTFKYTIKAVKSPDCACQL